MATLITGGAGYVGSATVELLARSGRDVVVVDNLSAGHRSAVPAGIPFYKTNIGDSELIGRIIDRHGIDECIHFAALAYVGESVERPAVYFSNNVAQGITFLNTLIEAGVSRLVFSSTCATYGIPQTSTISEAHVQNPINPYGWSKFMMERILESYNRAYGLRFVGLRYFNAAGATELHGEHHEPETHLIPNVLATARGQQPHVNVFGNDYPTPDGTAIRDYIHIQDLGSAHLLALDYLRAGQRSDFLNLGTGRGHSILEIVEAARKLTGSAIPLRFDSRRPGDPPQLVAESGKARSLLGWTPVCSELDNIMASARKWHESHPFGYVEPAAGYESGSRSEAMAIATDRL